MKFMMILTLCWLITPHIPLAQAQAHDRKIIVTLTPLSGLVAMLLPEVKSQCLLTAGADPHHFQPSPRQVDLLSQGHLLLRASHDDQGWPIQTQQSQTFDLWKTQSHAWLQFEQVQQVLPQLSQLLGQTFPAYQTLIQQRLTQAQQHVETMKTKWQGVLNKLQKTGVIIQHPAWKGVFTAQNIPIWSVLESQQHGHEHGPKHLEQALNTLIKHPNALLLGDQRHSNRSLNWLASHHPESTHSPIIQLDALGSCNQSWYELMQSNLERLQSSL